MCSMLDSCLTSVKTWPTYRRVNSISSLIPSCYYNIHINYCFKWLAHGAQHNIMKCSNRWRTLYRLGRLQPTCWPLMIALCGGVRQLTRLVSNMQVVRQRSLNTESAAIKAESIIFICKDCATPIQWHAICHFGRFLRWHLPLTVVHRPRPWNATKNLIAFVSLQQHCYFCFLAGIRRSDLSSWMIIDEVLKLFFFMERQIAFCVVHMLRETCGSKPTQNVHVLVVVI